MRPNRRTPNCASPVATCTRVGRVVSWEIENATKARRHYRLDGLPARYAVADIELDENGAATGSYELPQLVGHSLYELYVETWNCGCYKVCKSGYVCAGFALPQPPPSCFKYDVADCGTLYSDEGNLIPVRGGFADVSGLGGPFATFNGTYFYSCGAIKTVYAVNGLSTGPGPWTGFNARLMFAESEGDPGYQGPLIPPGGVVGEVCVVRSGLPPVNFFQQSFSSVLLRTIWTPNRRPALFLNPGSPCQIIPPEYADCPEGLLGDETGLVKWKGVWRWSTYTYTPAPLTLSDPLYGGSYPAPSFNGATVGMGLV